MSMIFDSFPSMQRAIDFAATVEERYGLKTKVFSDPRKSHKYNPVPYDQEPPIVHVERVEIGEGFFAIEMLKRRFGLTDDEVKAGPDHTAEIMAEVAAQNRVTEMGRKFGGVFLGT
jgi:hypothetical protein